MDGVDFIFEVGVGVNLCACEVFVSQEFLEGADVRHLQELCRVCVAEHVGVDGKPEGIKAGSFCDAFDCSGGKRVALWYAGE